MRLREFITHAMTEYVGRSGSVLPAAAGLVLAASVGAFATDREDCATISNPDQSIAACARVIADDVETAANRAVAYENRGNANYSKKDYDRAIADYNEAIRLDPKYPAVFNDRGLAYSVKGDYDRAIADYSEAIRLDPKYAAFFNNRGLAYSEKGDKDRAIADYNEAIRLDPNLTTPTR